MSKPYLSDFHLHSKYSFDGEMELETICELALEKGMQEIAITDHADLYHGHPLSFILDAPALYAELEEIRDRYEGRLLVRLGSELGQPQRNPAEAQRFLDSYPLDFVIGSIHNIEGDYDIYYYDYPNLDCYAMYDHYLDWILDLAENYDYDVLGHLTYPLRCMANDNIHLDLTPFYEKIESIYQIVIRRDKGIECNTSGLFQSIRDTMPSLDLLQLYHDCGGRILTLGSDAHHPQHVSLPILDGVEQLKRAGFTEYCTFEKRCPVFHKL